MLVSGLKRAQRQVGSYCRTTLARNAGWSLLGQGLRLVIQGVYFVVIARSLGSKGYGAFVGVAAAAAVLSPIVGLGCGKLLVKNVSRDRGLLAEYFGNGLVVTAASGLLAVAILAAGAGLVLPSGVPMTVLLLVAVSDLVVVRLADLVGDGFQAIERLGWTARLTVAAGLVRLASVVVLAAIDRHPSVANWAWAYFVSGMVTAVLSLGLGFRYLSRPRLALHRIRGEVLEGLYFAIGQSSQSIYNDIDKTMLARLSTFEATGIYSAAYKLVDMACLPLKSLLAAAYPGFFRAGADGLRGTIGYMRRLLPQAMVYGAAVGLALIIAAPLVPAVLGAEFARSVEAIRWLAVLPLLRAVHYLLADSLTGAGYQGVRSALQLLVAGVNVLINLWIVPAYSWRGAAWSSIGTDALLAVIVAAVLYITATSAAPAAARRPRAYASTEATELAS